jgi:alpha-beta hydrolase superfamily lysophospholipase
MDHPLNRSPVEETPLRARISAHVPTQHSALSARDVTFRATDGLALRAWHWVREAPRGVLVIAHGLGEHGGAYGFVAEAIASRLGIDVLAFDFRGHGHSPGRRGVVRSYEDFLADLRGALAWARRERPGVPVFLLGHSNGGLVALRALLDGEPGIAALVLSNPALRLAQHVPLLKLWAGAVLRRVAPRVTLQTDVTPEALIRDPEILASRQRDEDPLRHSRICAPLFFGMIEAGEFVRARAEAITIPTLLILGGSDPVIDPQTTLAFFDRLASTDKRACVYPESLHEPLHDLCRDQIVEDIVAWLTPRREPDRVGR